MLQIYHTPTAYDGANAQTTAPRAATPGAALWRIVERGLGLGAQPHPDALRASTLPLQGRVFAARRAGYFLPYGFGVVWLCMPANGEGAGAPLSLFLSALGFFFSLLLRIWPFAMASSGFAVSDSKVDGAI
jgi:hypothetical protein